ncbi:bile acid:sodium symporter family protein [Cellulosimicrobium marinum]|uniref:bile acid:sodium symporter family protein n=1 Tax=Cellulosimicrobium marinum TaxID=1638992 RepID=UPI001E5EB2F4|nr:bile acid:sodium symporter family protein [Cellulosimicrobium marinum]MCB7136578.1 bile acid:sodium symporter [Cellulosimicrobium marinum]
MRAVLSRWVDPFVVTLLVVLVLGLVVPVGADAQRVVDVVADVAVTVLFLVYGMRLSTGEVWAGLRNWRLQGGILASTYVVFPLLGILTAWAVAPVVGDDLAVGVLFLALLPSTVQSSVAFTSVARGNVAGAICGATVSNVLGMVITPLLVLWLLSDVAGGAGEPGGATGGLGGLRTVLLQLLLPFVVGQLLQPWVGSWVRARRWLTLGVDRGTILVVVFGAVAAATSAGVWSSVSGWAIVALLGVSALLLAVMLALTWWGGAALRLPVEDRVALLMCGSKKSLATGLPMASVLFPVAVAGVVAVPVIVFHQLQLVVCAVLARRLALRD